MKYLILIILIEWSFLTCFAQKSNDGFVKYEQVQLTTSEKQTLNESLKDMHERYDPEGKMITSTLHGYNYHTDAESGVYHDIRSSIWYAASLLDLGDNQYTQRAFDVIEKTISLQDHDPNSKSCGVWSYFQEEPLATKKTPIDYNWADFNAVTLLDVWMGHQEEIPEALKPAIKNSIILAARAVQKRNCQPGYTNIAIMGTYVTYTVSHLFDLPEMKDYAQKRLKTFYDYTLDKGGFTEYNSPTYTIVALDELEHMKMHIIEPSAKQMIDSLYSIGWEMIARHYHQPTGQWAGPHSRSYSTLVSPSFYAILKQGSNGKIVTVIEEKRRDVKIKHQIPEYLLHYFLSPEYPRTETDVFEKTEPKIIGTCYMTDKYVLSTANLSSLWIQRRPFLAYWGNAQNPKYLQVRFFHDFYDFTSVNFQSQQKENNVLAGISFSTNGGDKHPSFDRLKDGRFKAKDLRLRFEFGNVKAADLTIPSSDNAIKSFFINGLQFNIQLYQTIFDQLKGHWEKGGDEKSSWVDFVIYSGAETDFDLSEMKQAVMSFTFSMGIQGIHLPTDKPDFSIKDGILNTKWNGLILNIPVKPQPRIGWNF
ncbi:MAG: hypothetical protein PHR83_11190 [Paludibacter sp.]|nr:hypothetical protein [Paludibacter sp.]